eukprot:scaffold494384_cov19-Prasinocladus_malaysianus.AAC.1
MQFNKGAARVVMRKKDIHPQWYEEAKVTPLRPFKAADVLVVCGGEEVMSLGGTKPEYVVDIWSGNHPFFQGNTSTMVVDEGRVNRFAR